MTPEELKKRTKQFALRVIKLYKSLPKGKDNDVLGMQLLRAATSVGANYRAACRARSDADFISKITVVEEEADESAYWIELFIESGIIKKERLKELLKEANELTAIFTASGNTAKTNHNNSQFKIRNPK
ncbi:MAG: four helix bundle protein [Bacteroidetes bacterium]|nr:four helix bundle protein [Bacteroidota bacterium]